MDDILEKVLTEVMNELITKDIVFKSELMDILKLKIKDAVIDLDLSKIIDEELSGLVRHLLTNDDDIYNDTRYMLSKLIGSKLEVRVKND